MYIPDHHICLGNTWTNVAYILGGLIFARHTARLNLAPRYIVAYLMFVIVGIGSFAFHATLLYEMQLMDEIPMLFNVSHAIYCL